MLLVPPEDLQIMQFEATAARVVSRVIHHVSSLNQLLVWEGDQHRFGVQVDPPDTMFNKESSLLKKL